MKRSRKMLALMLTMAMILTMSLGTLGVYAADEESAGLVEAVTSEDADLIGTGVIDIAGQTAVASAMGASTKPIELADGSAVTPVNLNSSKKAAAYTTPSVTAYTDYTYTVHMPSKGTLRVFYSASDAAAGCYVRARLAGATTDLSGTACKEEVDGTTVNGRLFIAGTKSDITLTISVYRPSTLASNAVVFSMDYVPAVSKILSAGNKWKTYFRGGTGSMNTSSTLSFKVPAKGYLVLNMGDISSTEYSIKMRTSGFKKSEYEYLTANDAQRYIGVKKGTYKITVKTYAAAYGVRYKFVKVGESGFGVKKKNAVAIKKGSLRKGLIITNNKKVHWYKFKNPKLQKVRLNITSKLCGGGYYGGIRVTVYDKKGQIGTSLSIPYDRTGGYIKPYTLGKNNKLVKGTYYVKIESYNSGNGYFTLKWK